MRKTLLTWILLSGLLLPQLSTQAMAADYDFPFADPYLATILGTPADQKAPFAWDMPFKLLDTTVLPERKVPGLFWYNETLRSSLVYQKGKAPLIFMIAGTGAGFNSDKMLSLQSTFYQAGFHVVSISSPTHANFVTAASESMTPGILKDDARDLYRVMQKIWEQIRGEIEVSEFYLTGFSLGATQSAFVSMLDEQEKTFNFRKVLMINPSVNLYTSVTLLDHMLEDNIPGGAAGAGKFLRRVLDNFATTYAHGDFVKFDHEFLFNIYRNRREPPKDENLKALIGISFRISSSNMIFSSDVMTGQGFVVPKGVELDGSDSLGQYLRTLIFISFEKYLDEFLLPVAQARDSKITRQMLLEGSGLKSIQAYLKRADKVGVLTNADDIILGPGDLDFLRQEFGDRATIFPRGGHGGNIDHREVAAAMTKYFTLQ